LISLFGQLDTVGLKYVHYSLIDAGHESSILYLSNFNPRNRRQLENIKDFLLKEKPDFIGMSLMSEEFYKAGQLTGYIKSFIKTVPIIWGGIHPTITPESCLEQADYVCVGEGENVVRDIADTISRKGDLRNVNNLCYMEDGRMIRNPLSPRIEDLDNLPMYEHIPRNSYILNEKNILALDRKTFTRYARNLGKTYSIMSSRGCPFACTYCCNNFISRLYNSRKIRRRSIDNIIKELEKALGDNPEIDIVNFQDDCLLAASEDYLSDLFALYKKKINKPFIARTIPSYVTPIKLRLLKDAGIGWIDMGLQSGSERTCKEIYKRSSTKTDFLKVARMVKELKVAAIYDIILDNPFENEEDELETLETVMDIPKPYYMELFSLTLYPGTELYEKAKHEFPQYTEGQLDKNYLMPSRKKMNDIIRLATLIDKRYMVKIVNLYKQHSDSFWFGTFLAALNLMSLLILQPLTYFRVILLSQGGSLTKTLKALPLYFGEGIKRYLSQFFKSG
jgi:anaerobic magnesium-protoporphyrin IX monomethyl ester cyclase